MVVVIQTPAMHPSNPPFLNPPVATLATRKRSNVFGVNVDRLQAAKNKYDPKNLVETASFP
jgi:hypothetical protein